jgi:hypothetical protein
MAVFSISTWRAVPGRATDLLGSMIQAKKILEANGAVVRAWQPLAGGEAGSINFVAAYPDHVAYGTTMQAMDASAEWQTFWTHAMADPSGVNVENMVMYDLDPHQGLPAKDSRVLLATSFRTRPGRLGDHLAHQAAALVHLQRLGAQVRTLQSIGRNSGSITTFLGFEDFAHYGEFSAKFEIDEQWGAFWLDLATDPSAEQGESILSSRLDLG